MERKRSSHGKKAMLKMSSKEAPTSSTGEEVKSEAITRAAGAAPSIKIVQIFSPLVVKTDAANFRALVQQLTGKDSGSNNGLEVVQDSAPPILSTHHHESHNELGYGGSCSPSADQPTIWDFSIDGPLDHIPFLDDLVYSHHTSPS